MKGKQSLFPGNEGQSLRNKLKIFRVTRDLTQEQLADKLAVSRQTINAIESNKYLPSLGLAFKIAKLFKVKIEDLFFDEGGDNEN
ncbi:MAG: antitoxin HipB [Microgenomates group bacterium ADurb.Bin219]|nr:MAG: antitoxin HipB [Microgenomates group bacterium ADurb.Bin219]